MGSIVEFFNRRKREVDRIVDQTYFQLLEATAPIEEMYPRKNYNKRKLLSLRMTRHRPTVASIVAEGQEIPASRPNVELNEDLFSNCKVGKQIIWKDKDYELMDDLRSALAGSDAQTAKAIETHYFGEAADLVPAIYDKSLLITMQLGTTGTCNFTDPLSGAKFVLTYPTEATLMPAPLTGNARWAQSATSAPLENLRTLSESWYDINGSWATRVAIRRKNLRELADANSTKIAKLRMSGADSATPDVTGLYIDDEEAIAMIKRWTKATTVIVFDAKYSEEQADGTIQDKYFLPDDYVVLGDPAAIEQAFVPTIEKKMQPGIYQASKELNDAPLTERTVAVGNMVPACFDTRKLCARKVN
jgi:hypothetical protein